jgi:hypothetical protein
MVISTVVVILWRSQNIVPEITKESSGNELLISEAQPLKRTENKDDITAGETTDKTRKEIVADAEDHITGKAVGGKGLAGSEKLVTINIVDSVAEANISAISEEVAAGEIPSAPARASFMAKAADTDEVVVISNGAAKRISTKSAGDRTMAEKNVKDEYNAPEPVTGIKQFNEYIEKNLRNPDKLKDNQKVVVVIGFTVKADGTIANIKFPISPGAAYSTEAKRLIEEGPLWKPATENGIPVDDEVRIRIVFK